MSKHLYLTIPDSLFDTINNIASNKQINIQKEILYTLIQKYIGDD
jgi:hypothetical protein